ncbi:Rpn family recombination-promoting nuclease/putative transposase [Pedobacter hartonius]|uniref:PD-(D/E)XK nuclease family transposase n=1 Tax=Pedobacter hartonius TaxID=425514 RepID=A0A1H4HG71_9SPHI|nr:Rpn family recombination-promoting nuclease/putative transposase [Pedobacter hartonius]SEB20028.1 conserved hypothetical protein (putative transposase or invertase) [Pedobacter hartonius]
MALRINRYIDPLTDFGFKHLFGTEAHKEIMIKFLNALFEGSKTIVDITYGPTEKYGDAIGYKKVFFDLLCTGDDGEQFVIEMQRGKQKYFRERCMFYLSRLISQQLPAGKPDWNVQMKEVHLIGIMDFSFEDSSNGEYYHDIAFINKNTEKVFHDHIGLKFVELPNFNTPKEKLKTELDKWFYLLKNMHSMDKIPEVLNNEVFQTVFETAEVANLNREERMIYESNLKAKWDYEASIAYAAEEATLKNKQEIAGAMKQEGYSFDEIAKLTKLQVKEIENLK